MTVDNSPWQDRAACHGLTALFFPERGQSANEAKAVCKTCPVTQQCEEAGEDEHSGIWSGKSERQRRAGRSQIVGVHTPINHGTPHGYNTHLRRLERPCDPCRLAHNEQSRLDRYGPRDHPPAPVASGVVSPEYREDLRRLFALLNTDDVEVG